MVLRQIASFVLWAATAVAQPDHVATCNLPCGGPEVPADCVSWTNMCETCSIPQPLARQAECAVRVQPDACGPLRSIFNSCSQSRTRFAEVNGLVPFVLTTHEEGYDEQRLMVELPPCRAHDTGVVQVAHKCGHLSALLGSSGPLWGCPVAGSAEAVRHGVGPDAGLGLRRRGQKPLDDKLVL